MSRKESQTNQDPDLEALQSEKENVEGQKNTLQTEVLGIAQNKKELEANFENAKNHLQDEFDLKKQTLEKEIADLEVRCATLRLKIKGAEEESEQAINEKNKVVVDKEFHQNEYTRIKTESEKENVVHTKLLQENKILTENIVISKSELERYTKEKNTFLKEIFDLKKVKGEVFEENVIAEKKLADAREELVKITRKQNEVLEETVIENQSLEKVQKQVSDEQIKLLDIQKKVSEHESQMQKRESEVNEKMGNLSRLEIRVDSKLEQLKEIKKEFTTEHLARMGYKD